MTCCISSSTLAFIDAFVVYALVALISLPIESAANTLPAVVVIDAEDTIDVLARLGAAAIAGGGAAAGGGALISSRVASVTPGGAGSAAEALPVAEGGAFYVGRTVRWAPSCTWPSSKAHTALYRPSDHEPAVAVLPFFGAAYSRGDERQLLEMPWISVHTGK